MRPRTMTLGAVSVLAAGLLIAASASAQSDEQTVAPPSAQTDDQNVGPSYLFTFEGRNVELTPVGRSKTTFKFSVAIRGRDHLVGWFTDRPVRDAGHLTVNNFVRLWNAEGPNSFKTDPPNVALAFGLQTLVAVMTEPRIIATKDRGEALVATFTLIQGEELSQIAAGSGAIVAHARRAGDNTLTGPLRIARAGLFIDAYQTSDDPAPTPAPATSSPAPAPAPEPPPPFPIPPPPPPWPYPGCMDWTCGI